MIKELLNAKSPVSSMRLMSIIALLWACILSGYGIVVGRDLMGLAGLCSVFISAAFVGKAYQKSIERNNEEDK